MNIVITVVSTLLILTALIVAHEFGHFIVARKRGIKVDEFSIGFGPRLFKWGKGETQFSLRAIPAGGFVRFADDIEKEPQPGDLRAASIKSRVLTILAGPAMNIVVAIVLTAILLMTAGDVQFEIKDATAGSPAYEAGLQDGDIIKKFNGIQLDLFYDWQDAQRSVIKEELPLQIVRGDETFEVNVPSAAAESLVGTNFTLTPKTFNFFEGIALSFKWIFLQMREILTALGKLFFTFQGAENMAGIVGTAQVVGVAVQSGYRMVLMLVSLISVNLAIINLLPIPALDGGKLVMYAIEGVRKKPVPDKVEGILNFIGMAAIIVLAVFLVVQDIGRLIPPA